MKKDIIVIGHKNPDTDSICSAISYAYLKNKISDGNYVPMRAGEVNPETAYVLDYFNVEAPQLTEDVRAQVKDADYKEGIAVDKGISLKKAWQLICENDDTILTVCEDEKVIGVTSDGDIAKFFMAEHDDSIVMTAKTPLKNILEAIEGKLVTGDENKILTGGKVVVATANASVLGSLVSQGDVVILADKVESQKTAIENGASCLISCLGVDFTDEVIELAKSKDVVLVTCKNDSYVTSRLLNQSVAIGYLIDDQQIIQFTEDEYIDDVKAVVTETRHREFPVVDKAGKFKGVLHRNNIIDVDKKKLIMVDHNEKTQAVDGMWEAEVQEIIDHHKVGHIQTLGPILYRNMPVGCTATIVYMMFLENQIEIPKEIAGLMCSAILSDTLLFRSPTCTPMDKEAGEKLGEIAGIDVEKYAMDMFGAGSDFGSKTDEEIFNLDYKRFNVGDVTYGIGQVSSVSKKELDDLKEQMLAYMEKVVANGEENMVYLMMTDILEESSELLCAGNGALSTACQAFGVEPGDRSVYLKGAVSRKKQIVPQLTAVLQ